MSIDENTLLPEPAPLEDEKAARFSRYWFDDTTEYRLPPYLLEYNGDGFSPLGGIQAISGQKKNGKSWLVSQIIGTCLSGELTTDETGAKHYVIPEGSRILSKLPGLRMVARTVEMLGHMPNILYADTEQERENTSRVIKAAKWYADLPVYEHCDRLDTLWLRQMDIDGNIADERFNALLWALENKHYDLVMIDGIRDMINNFNDLQESSEIVNRLMSKATESHCCIWNTLHMNPRPSNDDESKMRGHLGTELGNKVSDSLVVKKTKDKASGRISFTVSQMDARGKDLDDWTFSITEDGQAEKVYAVGVIEESPLAALTGEAKEREPDSLTDIQEWITKANRMYIFPLSRRDVKEKIFKQIGGQKNNDVLQKDLDIAINEGLLKESTLKKGGYYMLDMGDELPF
jgi:hypothetical protein